MRQLEARGCRFWVFGEREFLSRTVVTGGLENKRGVFGSIIQRARILARLQIKPELCESEHLNAVAIKLEELRPEVDAEAETNADGRLGRFAQSLWRVENEAAGLCDEPSSAERDRFADVSLRVTLRSRN